MTDPKTPKGYSPDGKVFETRERPVYDVAIIGAGPGGLYAAFYASLRKMTVAVFDSMPEVGGQLAALYPEKSIYDVAGFPEVRARDLVKRLHQQVAYYEPDIFLEEEVTGLRQLPDGNFELATSKGHTTARTVIIAAGLGLFSPRKLDTGNVSKWEGKGVFYGVKQISDYEGKRVLIVGGGDSAVDWALLLQPVAKEVTLIHRRPGFRAHEGSLEALRESPVRIMIPYELKDVNPKEGGGWEASIFHNKTDEVTVLDVDAVVISIGFVSSLGAIREWGLELDGKDIVVDRHMQTNIPGVFAIGDIATYPGKVKLISVACGEAPVAVSNAKLHIDPTARLQPAHSSTARTGEPA